MEYQISMSRMETITLSDSRGKELPEHFPHESIRPLQGVAIKAISAAWESGRRYVFLEAPTGFGKSAVAITLARQDPKAFILVSTRTLQDQYVRERAYKTMQVKGRGNFECLLSKKRACDVGPCQVGVECKHRPMRASEGVPLNGIKIASTERDEFWVYPNLPVCHYWEQKCHALEHRYPVMNYSYFLHEVSHAGDFGKRRLMICDEAHGMEGELMRFIEFSVSDLDLKLVNCRIPEEDISVEGWVGHLKEWGRNLALELDSAKEKADKDKKPELIEKIQELAGKISKCYFIADEISKEPDNWIIDRTEANKARKVAFRPIFVKRWGRKFSDMAERFLLQSATIIDAESIAESLGLPEDECVFLRAGSDFVPERRPVYYNPVGRMSPMSSIVVIAV